MSLDGFVEFCGVLRLENGKRFELYPEQKVMLGDFFDGVRETLILLPKKNGKTSLVAALALYHLETTSNAECVIGASSQEQATIMYRQAAGFVERSDLPVVVQGGYRRILSSHDSGRIRVMAADANTADGVIPTLALVDELHRHRSDALYAVFRDGLGPRQGQLVTISTAGAAMDSPLGRLRMAAYEIPGFRIRGTHRHVRNDDFALHEWALGSDDDVDDLEVVAEANPAPWQTVEELRRRHDSPSMTPWQWRRFACGIWTEGEEPWINPELWDRLKTPDLTLDDDLPVWIGVDVGVKHDSTAVVTVANVDGVLGVKARVLVPGAEGVPLEMVEQAVRDACDDRQVVAVLYDPWTFRRSAELLGSEGLPMVEFPQSPERMANASANLYRLIEAGQLAHDGDPVLRAHVVAGVTKQTERGWRLVKDPKLSRPIDALIALAMACLPAAAGIVKEEMPAFAWA